MFLGIDGLVDMKPIYGTTAAEKKAKQEKEGKVKISSSFAFSSNYDFVLHFYNIITFLIDPN